MVYISYLQVTAIRLRRIEDYIAVIVFIELDIIMYSLAVQPERSTYEKCYRGATIFGVVHMSCY